MAKVLKQKAVFDESGFTFGGSAQKAYERFCGEFGWDKRKSKFFMPMNLLYATNVTAEGYSVWFMTHSNLEGGKASIWNNRIMKKHSKEYYDAIEEKWEESWEKPSIGQGLYTDQTTRVVFAKLRDGQYIFLGIFIPEEIVKKRDEETGKVYWLKNYRLVSEQYPEKYE